MKVSVVIPCHNAGPYLPQAIGSVLEQTSPAHEVIVVDDGSTDGSLAVARRFRAAFGDRVRVLAQRSGSAARTRNVGASEATGDALMFLDADDVLAPDALEGLVRALGESPAGVALCPWYRLDRVGGTWVQHPPSCRPRRPGQDALSAWLTGWYHPPCSVLWSRDGFERAGRWDELCAVNDDGDLMMRALTLGVVLVETAVGAGYYRRLPQGETSLSGTRYTRAGLHDRLRVVHKIAYLLEERGRIGDYRTPLAEALERIAADAGEDADIRANALAAARRYAPLRERLPASTAVRSAGQGARVLQQALRRRAPRRLRQPVQRKPPPAREVSFGRRAAERAAAGRPPAGAAPPEHPRRPAVSVIVPTHNRAHVLPRALDSVLAQTMGDFEVLVVDDGSTDDTAALVACYDDARVRYLRQPRNQGVSATRNRGLRAARADLIAFLDSDDEWFPHKLQAQVDHFRTLPDEVGLVYGGVENDDGRGHRHIRVPDQRGNLYRNLLVRNVIHGTSGVMIRRCVVAAVGFFDEGIPAIEDYDYWLRLARFFEFDFVEEPLIRYHDPGAENRKSLAVRDNLDARRWLYRKHKGDMIRAGVAHLYLLESARRHQLAGDRAGACRLALQALAHAPTSPRARIVLARTVLPGGIRGRLRAVASRALGPRQPTTTGMRVLLYSSTSRRDSGGVQAVYGQLAAGLRRRGHTVHDAWAQPHPEEPSGEQIYPLALPRTKWAVPVPWTVLAAARSFARLAVGLHRYRPDIVNVHFLRAEILHLLLLRRVFRYKLVLSAHGSDVLLPADQDAELLPRLVPRADAITAVTRPVAERIRDYPGVDPARIHTIPNGVDFDFWSAPPAEPGAGPASATVLTVGRLLPVKGHDILLEAVGRLRSRVPEIRLVVVGGGPLHQDLQERAAALGIAAAVTLTGHLSRDEVRAQMHRAGAFALPSRSEGMPLALLEAMSAGLACVATRVGGVPDILVPGTGLLAPPEDAEALADGLELVLIDPDRNRELGARARQRARQFSVANVEAAYEKLFLGLVAER